MRKLQQVVFSIFDKKKRTGVRLKQGTFHIGVVQLISYAKPGNGISYSTIISTYSTWGSCETYFHKYYRIV